MNFHISKICISLNQMQMNCVTLDKLEESFMSVNSIYFLLLHIFLFIAILNQEGTQPLSNQSQATRPWWEYLKKCFKF